MNDFLWWEWNLAPPILFALGIVAVAYAWGIRNLVRAGGRTDRARIAACAGAWLALALAFISPLNALADNLLSAHVLQHMLVVLVAAPLFILGAAPFTMAAALPVSLRRHLVATWNRSRLLSYIWHWLNRAPVAWLIFASVLWLWHLPLFYHLSIASEWLHFAEHGTFLAAALLFWWALVHPVRQADFGPSIISAFTTALQSGALGAALAFSARPWYSVYGATTVRLNFAPLADQQLAGLFIWIPSSIVYALAAMILFTVWLNSVEREMREQQQLVLGQDNSAFVPETKVVIHSIDK